MESCEIQERKCYFLRPKWKSRVPIRKLTSEAMTITSEVLSSITYTGVRSFLGEFTPKLCVLVKTDRERVQQDFDTVYPSKGDVKNKWCYIYIYSIPLYFVDRDNLILPCG